MIKHHLRSYIRRLWPAWLTYVFCSSAASVLAWSHPVTVPGTALAVLEWTALAWFTVQLMHAESAFATHGGWQVRPVTGRTLTTVRWLLFFSALLPAFLCRAWFMHRSVDLSDGLWFTVLWREWLPWLAVLSLAAAALHFTGRRSAGHPVRRWSAIGAGLFGGVIAISLGCRLTGTTASSGGSSGGFGPTLRGMLPHVPAGDRVIVVGDHAGGKERRDVPLREVMRVPLRAGTVVSVPGLRVKIQWCRPTGLRLAFAAEFSGASHRVKALGRDPALAVRYSNGVWGTQRNYEHRTQLSPLPGMNIVRHVESGDFYSPMMEPWNQSTWPELLADAELIVFAPDPAGPLSEEEKLPPYAWGVGAEQQAVVLPELPARPAPAQLQAAAQAAVNQLQVGAREIEAIGLLKKGGAAIVPHVLACGPFANRAWEQLEPFLVKTATEEHLPALLRLLETDTRAGELLVQKGWKDQALPALRKALLEGLPLGFKSLTTLAELKDPALADALKKRAIRGVDDMNLFPNALHDHPGIDWPSLVRDAWYHDTFFGGHYGTYWRERGMVTGDREIFRSHADVWLRSSRLPDKAAVRSWISPASWSGEPKNFPAWLRANFNRLRWNKGTGKWELPAQP